MRRDRELEAFVGGELAGLGFELVKLETSILGRRWILRLFIDHPERGVTIDDCVNVTKAIGFALDGEGLFDGPYNLEVSSPGMNRPLTKPEHFGRYEGREARIEYARGGGAKETVVGEIVGTDDEAVTISSAAETRRIRFGDIVRANLHGERWEISKGTRRKTRSRRG